MIAMRLLRTITPACALLICAAASAITYHTAARIPTDEAGHDLRLVMTDEGAVATWWNEHGIFSAAVSLNGEVTGPTKIWPSGWPATIATNGRDVIAAWPQAFDPSGYKIVFAPLDARGRLRGEPTVLMTTDQLGW